MRRGTFNRKLQDIKAQIDQSLESAVGPELVDAVDILEEGISYLREVQEAERITDEQLYFAFQPLAVKAMDKLVDAREEDMGGKTPLAFVDMLIEHRIAHTYHFSSLQKHILRRTQGLDGHAQALQVWIKYLEYSRSLPKPMELATRSRPQYMHERGFNLNDLLSMSYLSLSIQFLRTNTPYDLQSVVKVLQVEDASRVPDVFRVVSMVRRVGLDQALAEDVALFQSKLKDLAIEHMDPNGPAVSRSIENAVRQNNPRLLDRIFSDMKAGSVQNAVPISEATLNKIMALYIACKNFSEALLIFSYMLSGAIAKPSASSWELALKAMGHPSNVSSMSDKEKAEAINNIEAVVRTMTASGVAVNARSLGIIVGAFSCLNRQDLVQKYLQAYKDVPVVHMARDNILIGMALNQDIGTAEKSMKQYMAEDPSYKPSTNVMNSFLTHHVKLGSDKAVEGILNFMREHLIEESVATTTTIVGYYFKNFRDRGLVPDISDLFRELKNDTSKWDQQMVSALVDGLCKDGVNLDAARAAFKYFCHSNRRFKHSSGMLTSMIRAEVEFGSVHNAEELFDMYIQNVRNDTRMWNMMIMGLLRKREGLAMDYYRRFLQQAPFNVKPNFFTYFFLLGHFEKKGQSATVQALLDDLAASDMRDFGQKLPGMLQSLSTSYNVDPLLMKRVQSSGHVHRMEL